MPAFVITNPAEEETMKLTGAQALIKSLEMEGVEVMFGLPGGAILPVYDPLIDSSIRHILVRHEQGAGHMASGYAQATGRPGVAMVTSGPAATNIVTPLCDAYMDSIPMVVITGQVAYKVDRHRRVPGVRHRRHHHAGHEAQLVDLRSRRHPARDPRGLPRRDHRPARPGARRLPEGHREHDDGVVLAGAGRPARLQAHGEGPPQADQGRREAHPDRDASGDLRRRRHPEGERLGRAAGARGAHERARRHHVDGARRDARLASAVPRHAGHARQLHRGHVDAEVGSADHARRALRRPRDR